MDERRTQRREDCAGAVFAPGRANIPSAPENPAKRYLRRYISMRRYRDALADELREHYSTATSCAVRLKPIPISGGGGAYDRMAEDVCRIVDSRERLNSAIAQLDALLADVLAVLDAVSDDRLRELLGLRYVTGLRWEQIADRMGYEAAQIYRLHGRALIEVNRILADKQR